LAIYDLDREVTYYKGVLCDKRVPQPRPRLTGV